MGYAEGFNSTYDGLRSFAVNYLQGTNVNLWTRCCVEKVVVEDNTAKGVVISRQIDDGEEQRIYVMARNEIILSAGAQGSPKILLLRQVVLLLYLCSIYL